MSLEIHDFPVFYAYTAAPGQTSFAVQCRIFANYLDRFAVTVNGVAASYNAAPTLTSEWKSVPAAYDAEGGYIVFGAAFAGGEEIVIQRNLAVERLTRFPETGPVPMADVNLELDRLVALIQDVAGNGMGQDGGLRADLAMPDGAGLVGYQAGVTGAIARTLVSRLTRGGIYAADFGLVGDGTDEAAKLSAFFNSAIANPGVPHYLDGKTYRTSTTLPSLTVSGAHIEGVGCETRDALAGEKWGTWIQYTGAITTSPVISIHSVAGAGNRRTARVRFEGIGIDAGQLAEEAIQLRSILDCDIDVMPINARRTAVDAGCIATLAESRTSQLNRIRLKLRQVGTSAAGVGITFSGDSTANWSLNHFWVEAVHENAPVVLTDNVDNNDWWSFRSYCVPGGTATDSVSLLGGPDEPRSARSERFHYFTANKPMQLYGTPTYAQPAHDIRVHLDTANGTPEPILGTGCTAFVTKSATETNEAKWVDYVPIVTPIGGAVTTWSSVSGRYRKIGKMVDFKLTFTVVANGTGSIGFTATAPVAAGGSIGNVFTGKESAVNNKAITGLLNGGSSSIAIYNFDGTYPGVNGGVYTLSGQYEVA